VTEGVVHPHRTTYEQRTMAVLKAIAVNRSTIAIGDLAWTLNYQRTTRPLTDLLAGLRPILEDHGWPPLTCLVVLPTHKPALTADQVEDVRMQQRRCYVWASEQSTERQRMRGQWAETILGGDIA